MFLEACWKQLYILICMYIVILIKNINFSSYIKMTIKLLKIRYENSGLFLSLLTVPRNKNPKEFFEKEFRDGLFKKYFEELVKNSNLDYKEEENNLKDFYLPKAYYLFGEFDLAIISLVDDFALANRIFHPGHNYRNEDEKPRVSVHYDYQIVSGLINSKSLLKTKVIVLTN